MRDLVKIYDYEIEKIISPSMGVGVIPIQTLCTRKLKQQIGRRDITVLNITKVENIREGCLECYVDYEFWGGK